MYRCRIYTGSLFEEDGKIKFVDTHSQKVDNGYVDIFNEVDFKKHIQKMAKLLGMYVDAYKLEDKEEKNLIWSNYREVQESEPDKDELIDEYEKLSGEKAKGNWGVKKLSEEINKLKEQK